MTMAHVIDGRALALDLTNSLKTRISAGKFLRAPGLATVLVGDDKASAIYVSNKRKKAEEVGIKSFHHHLDGNVSKAQLLAVIASLNANENVDAILVQLPLPKNFNEREIIDAIDPKKDADGICTENLGLLFRGEPQVIPCTPSGMMHMMRAMNFSAAGKHAVVVGRSTIVGKPMAHLLLQDNATVTICHSHTKNLQDFTRQADILVAAVGRPLFITRDHVKPGAFVLDVGINRDAANKLCGDVDFHSVKDLASFITPVPFGVGPMTIAMLLENTLTNFLRKKV